jgi:hypothetical protein
MKRLFMYGQLALGALAVHGCLFAFADDSASGGASGTGYSADGSDPAQGDSGEKVCERVEDDGTCVASVLDFVDCTCPWPYRCADSHTLLKCFDGGFGHPCAVSWRGCGPLFDEYDEYPDETCLDDGAYGSGCYVEGEPQPGGWVRHCNDAPPCDNDVETADCVLLPGFIGWDTTIPSVGAAPYSCFEDCRHVMLIGDVSYDCGACCDACNISSTEWQTLCGPSNTTTTGGGQSCSDLVGQYPKTGVGCTDNCIENVLDCFIAANCTATQSCVNGYQSCLTNCL